MIDPNLIPPLLFAITLVICCKWLFNPENFENQHEEEERLKEESNIKAV